MSIQKSIYFILKPLKLMLIFFVLIISLSSTQLLMADFIDTDDSFFNFTTLLNFASGLTGDYDELDQRDNVRNINNQFDELIVEAVSFKNYSSAANNVDTNFLSMSSDDDVEPAIVGLPLVYPNPFRQSTDDGAEIQFVLSKDMSIEIHIYNMLARRVFYQTFAAGGYGGSQGMNVLQINNESLGGYVLSSGVYFYLFVFEGKVLHKGKMVVKP